ncbi:RTA1-domain-containing protein [Sporormia fimetaria CBS 119925]|uniref:RTA1-domain-containing protein n=1 Tax=Sporormia fimetaria CBS 119925 TaxID=1340428 RepID=A0A6A6V416_9PLEO|nr:RTA1-domain-containing protein [Sporormia fimetaria CBS 119925]
MDPLTLLVRSYGDNIPIDPNNIDIMSTNPIYIAKHRKFCRVFEEPKCPLWWGTIRYRPTMAGNTIYLICFLALLGFQLFFGIRKKTWTYMGVVSAGILLECIGYVGRLMLNRNPFLMDNFLMNLIPLTIAPALLTAGIYLCLARVIVVNGAENSRLKPKLYTYVFVGFDVLSLVLQSIGGAMAATGKDAAASRLGTNVMIAGLISQVVSMVMFFTVWGNFVLHMRKAKKEGSLRRMQPSLYEKVRGTKMFTGFQWSLFVAAVLIFIRCVYRVAELWEGFSGHLANDEVTFMIFEGPMILVAVTAMTVFHPGRVFDDLWAPAGQGVRHGGAGGVAEKLVSEPEWPRETTAYERV